MKVKIHCFEGEWDNKHQELSVKPLIEVLEQSYKIANSELTYTYKFCQTISRLKENLHLDGRKLSKSHYRHCLYFAFHGTNTGLFSADGTERLSFGEIALLLSNKVAGSIIFFGSCGARHTSRKELEKLKELTDAALVVGYGSTVDWLASSAFEMLFFNELCRYKTMGRFVNRIRKLTAPGQELFANLEVLLLH